MQPISKATAGFWFLVHSRPFSWYHSPKLSPFFPVNCQTVKWWKCTHTHTTCANLRNNLKLGLLFCQYIFFLCQPSASFSVVKKSCLTNFHFNFFLPCYCWAPPFKPWNKWKIIICYLICKKQTECREVINVICAHVLMYAGACVK